jgi:hypothetical protein
VDGLARFVHDCRDMTTAGISGLGARCPQATAFSVQEARDIRPLASARAPDGPTADAPTAARVPPIAARVPPAADIVRTYLACLFPIQAWSVYALLHELPAWLVQLSAWDVIGVVSYTEALALVESLVVFIPVLALAIVLPSAWLKRHFVAAGTGAVYLAATWFALAAFNDETVASWGVWGLAPWLGVVAVSIIAFVALIDRNQRFRTGIVAFVDRIWIVAAVYVVLDAAAIAILVVRNA